MFAPRRRSLGPNVGRIKFILIAPAASDIGYFLPLFNNSNARFTYILQSLVLLLQFRVHLHEGFLSLVKLVLDGLDLFLEGASLFLSLRKVSRYIFTFIKYFSYIINCSLFTIISFTLYCISLHYVYFLRFLYSTFFSLYSLFFSEYFIIFSYYILSLLHGS